VVMAKKASKSARAVVARVRGLRSPRQAEVKAASRTAVREAVGVARSVRLRAPRRSDGQILRGLADRTICGARLSRRRLGELQAAGFIVVDWAVEGAQRWITKIVITEAGAKRMEEES
jgi:hypothetical protein